jgi:hypothetical protein
MDMTGNDFNNKDSNTFRQSIKESFVERRQGSVEHLLGLELSRPREFHPQPLT